MSLSSSEKSAASRAPRSPMKVSMWGFWLVVSLESPGEVFLEVSEMPRENVGPGYKGIEHGRKYIFNTSNTLCGGRHGINGLTSHIL